MIIMFLSEIQIKKSKETHLRLSFPCPEPVAYPGNPSYSGEKSGGFWFEASLGK
jgi:hypothetical protein